MDLSLQIDTVIDITRENFRKDYLLPQKPVIIKGLATGTPAGEKWSIDYFRNTMGHHMIDLYDNRNVKSSATANTKPDVQMKFADYLDIIEKDEHTDLRIFLFNMFKLNPALQDEYPCPDIFSGVLDKIGHMFFGGKDTTVRIHYDIDMSNVLHTHFAGRKRVVLIAPEYNDCLYRLPLNTYSLVDVHKPDYKKYPALALIKGYDFILEPGDALFMPSGYWHHMTYLEGGFSVSYRHIATSIRKRLMGFNYLGLCLPADKLANAIAGERWLALKSRLAERRADRAIERECRPALSKALFGDKHDMTFI